MTVVTRQRTDAGKCSLGWRKLKVTIKRRVKEVKGREGKEREGKGREGKGRYGRGLYIGD